MKTITIFVAGLVLVGTLAGSGAIIASLIAMVKFPPLLIAVILACWILSRLSTAAPLTI